MDQVKIESRNSEYSDYNQDFDWTGHLTPFTQQPTCRTPA